MLSRVASLGREYVEPKAPKRRSVHPTGLRVASARRAQRPEGNEEGTGTHEKSPLKHKTTCLAKMSRLTRTRAWKKGASFQAQ